MHGWSTTVAATLLASSVASAFVHAPLAHTKAPHARVCGGAAAGSPRCSHAVVALEAPAELLERATSAMDPGSLAPLLQAPSEALERAASLVPAELGAPVAGVLALGGAGAALAALLRRPAEPIGSPYPAEASAYDPLKAERFYASRLPVVVSRALRLARLTASFNVKLLCDLAAYRLAGAPEGESWPNEKERAKECLSLATQLGPTFIKLAQALSIRTDLIPEAYALELRKLQDAVPPFDSNVAKQRIARSLGLGGVGGLSKVFRELSAEPIASASIGQVYKGELLDGRQVAVKVQRPHILDEISLDLHLLRLLAPLQTRISNAINKLKTYDADIVLSKARDHRRRSLSVTTAAAARPPAHPSRVTTCRVTTAGARRRVGPRLRR